MHDLLTVEQAAARCGVAPKTLNNWRILGKGPCYIKSGGRVSYDPTDIEAWKAERRVNSTSQPVAA